MITKDQLEDQVTRVLGEDSDPRFDVDQIINQAGRYLFSMWSWGWRSRPPVTLDLVADQTYVLLPADFGFGEITSVNMTDNVSFGAELTSVDDITWLRGTSINAPNYYYLALVYPDQNAIAEEPERARLEVYPTPSGSSPGSLQVGYRAGWVELSADHAAANIPNAFDFLLAALVRAMSHQYQDDNPAYVDGLEQSAMVQRLKERDAASQSNSGQMIGGILQSQSVLPDYNWNWSGGGAPA